jgi:leucyl/phenylalanyl-tRNA--protein transferase
MTVKHLYAQDSPHSLPRPECALTDPDGLLAVGGSLSPPWLTHAYAQATFPWYPEDSAILWWSPSRRAVFTRDQFKQRRSLLKQMRRHNVTIAINHNFETVVRLCRDCHLSGGVWIHDDVIRAYTQLHRHQRAHSVEVYQGHTLIGGVYGVQINGVFFAESMFSLVPNASKMALMALIDGQLDSAIDWVDAQFMTDHLASLGAFMLSRTELLTALIL